MPDFEQSTGVAGLSFPEDEGTGLSDNENADFTSAGYFGSLAAQSNVSDYVESGLQFENVGGGTFDLTDGLAFIQFDGGVDVQDSDGEYAESWDQPITFSVLVRSVSDVEYVEGEENDIYLQLDLNDPNGVNIVVIDAGFAPDDPSLKIGEIDDT